MTLLGVTKERRGVRFLQVAVDPNVHLDFFVLQSADQSSLVRYDDDDDDVDDDDVGDRKGK